MKIDFEINSKKIKIEIYIYIYIYIYISLYIDSALMFDSSSKSVKLESLKII
jgi:hypothetical protein